MNDTARYEVDLDTRKAKADIHQLQRDKEQTGRRISSAARRVSSRALQAAAFTGAAAKFGDLRGQQPGGSVDLLGEAMLPLWAAAQQFTDAQLGYSAAARKTAREQTKAAFAFHVGNTGETAGMRDFYNTVSSIQNDAESGRNILRQDRRFQGIGAREYAEATLTGNLAVFLENLESSPFRVLMRGFDYIVEGVQAP